MQRLRFLSLALLAALGIVPAAQAINIGTVSLKRVTEEWSQSKKASEEAQAEAARIEADLKKEFEGYKALMAEAEQIRESYRVPAKNQEEDKMRREKIIGLLGRATQERERLDKKRTKVLFDYNKDYQVKVMGLLTNIQTVAGTVAKEKGLDMVVDLSGKTSHASALLLVSPPETDITDAVVQRLESTK